MLWLNTLNIQIIVKLFPESSYYVNINSLIEKLNFKCGKEG